MRLCEHYEGKFNIQLEGKDRGRTRISLLLQNYDEQIKTTQGRDPEGASV